MNKVFLVVKLFYGDWRLRPASDQLNTKGVQAIRETDQSRKSNKLYIASLHIERGTTVMEMELVVLYSTSLYQQLSKPF